MSRALFPLFRRHPIWRDAADATLAYLAEGSRLTERGAGQVLVIDGAPADAIWLIVDGTTRVFYAAKKGQPEVTVRLLRAPAGFGDVACVARGRYTASVEALGPVTAIAVDAERYFSALQRDARACFRQYWDVARRFAGAVDMERAALVSSLIERVVALVLAYADAGGGVVRLSQDDLAQQVGSNRRSIVRTMEQLYRTGGLARRGRSYVVVDRDKLLSAASSDVPTLVGSADAAPWAERA